MSAKAYAKQSLGMARMMTEGMIESLKSEDDWFYQAHPKANHPLWIIGHLGLADNAFAAKFRPEGDHKPDGWDELFWFGSEISSDRSKYPAPETVLAYFRERRENLLDVLDQASEEELSAAAPPADERSPIAGAPDVSQLFVFAAYHEGVHSGQLSVAHRGLGNPPMYQPQSVPAGTDGA